MLRVFGYLCYLAGMSVIAYAVATSVMLIGDLYGGVAADPLGEAGNDPEQSGGAILRARIPAAFALPLFIIGVLSVRLARRRRRVRG